MKDWLYVGQKVVFVGGRVRCWHTDWRRFVPGLRSIRLTHNLVRGETYTIEATCVQRDCVTGEDVVSVFIKGFRYIEVPHIAFPAGYFRPLQKRKTSIEVFTSMLSPKTREVEKA